MSTQKYELTGTTKVNDWGVTVHQIRATEDIPRFGVRKGDLGGWVESETLRNGDARVYGNAQVSGDARVSGNAWVSGNAQVYGNARVSEIGHYLIVGPIGSENVTATLFRTKNGKHCLNVGCWSGTLGTLMGEVKTRRVNWSADSATQERWVAQYRALKALGKVTVAGWVE